jgi:hypothetical protein
MYNWYILCVLCRLAASRVGVELCDVYVALVGTFFILLL